MGVADNYSYKDTYHFRGNPWRSDPSRTPSLGHEPKVNTSIKENKESSNVEIEKDEVVLQPDLTALFIAKGKTHKAGGINVQLEPDTFVFSNDKSLAFSKNDLELFELKEGGKVKKKNTPANVLRKNVD